MSKASSTNILMYNCEDMALLVALLCLAILNAENCMQKCDEDTELGNARNAVFKHRASMTVLVCLHEEAFK